VKQRYLVIDYETRSEADLKAVGGYEYALHPTTRIMCAAWKLGTLDELEALPEKVWSPIRPSPYGEFKHALLDKSVMLVAHNAFFEQVITRFVLSGIINEPYLKNIPHERWICTASLARSLALPGNLEGACKALGLAAQKDMDGHKLMMKMAKPRKARKDERLIDALEGKEDRTRWHNKQSDLDRLMHYCKTDVKAEAMLLLKCHPLIPSERKLWELDQRINFRGFRVDRDLVKKSLRLISQEIKSLNIETQELTDGAITSTNQRAALLKYLYVDCGFDILNLQAKTVSDVLASGVGFPDARRLLEIRQAVSKSSTAKYAAFESRSRHDSRCRDNLVFHLAGTGRWGGAGVQPQNLPRPKHSAKIIQMAIDAILEVTIP
jgi:DNA polymerase